MPRLGDSSSNNNNDSNTRRNAAMAYQQARNRYPLSNFLLLLFCTLILRNMFFHVRLKDCYCCVYYYKCILTFILTLGLSQGGNFFPPSQWQESGTNCKVDSRYRSRKETTSYCCPSSCVVVGSWYFKETSQSVARWSGPTQGEPETTRRFGTSR